MKSNRFKPMLASEATFESKIKFPVLVTPKLDGIRCVIHGGQALTRSLKPVPNMYIRAALEAHCPDGFDGEIIVHDEDGKPLPYNDIQSLVMSRHEVVPNFMYYVFDYVEGENYDLPYHLRVLGLISQVDAQFVIAVMPVTAVDLDDLKDVEKQMVEQGYEGICFRTPDSPYKFGRSTLKEGWLLKLKRFIDAEAYVIGFEERMSNQNAPIVNALGRIERPGGKTGLVPANTLGKLLVRDVKTGAVFPIGPGVLKAAERLHIWQNKEQYLGRLLTYRYQPYGEKDLPRFGRFKGWRDKRDL